MQMPAAATKLERFFFLYLIINPFLDIYSGAYIHIGSLIAGEKLLDLITPTLILRMLVLLLFAFYLLRLKDKPSLGVIALIALTWGLSLLGEFLFASSFSLFTDVQVIAKFTYNIVLILVYWRVFQRSPWPRAQLLSWLNWLFSFTALALSVSILLPFILGLGYSTYNDRFGSFGTRGFFFSGNDITAVLMLLIPITVVTYLLLPRSETRARRLFYLFAPAATLTALFAIATKTAFLAIGVTVGAMFIYCLHNRITTKDSSQLKAFGRIMLAAVGLFLFMSLFGLVQSFQESLGRLTMIRDEYDTFSETLFSGRIKRLTAAWANYQAGGPYVWLFGLGRSAQARIIEMDLFEVLFYYGLVGAGTMLWLYIKLGVGLVRRYLKRPDAYGLACFLSVGLCAGYAVLAGHVWFSVTSGFYFAFMLLYSHLYFAPTTAEMQILPQRN